MKQMTFSFYKSPTYVLNLVVHTEKPPGDEEWDATSQRSSRMSVSCPASARW